MNRIFAVLFFALAGGAAGGAPGPKVDFRSLLSEMTDLAALATFPDPPFTCRQFSSYDRKSKSPAEDWFANGDCGNYLRIEERGDRKEFVMMDVAGPGAIVRIWSANPKGTLRIWLDGEARPAIEAPMADFLGGRFPGNPSPIACETSRGFTSYLPIPYARRAVVTSDEGGAYYHVNYRTYAEGTRVETLGPKDLARAAKEIADVALHLPGWDDALEAGRLAGERVVTAGEPLTVSREGLAAEVTYLSVGVQADDLPGALRHLVLSGRFDGEETVLTPLGDFFCAVDGQRPVRSRPMGVEARGEMRCSFVMPCREKFALEVRNEGGPPAKVKLSANFVPRPWTDRSMYFHAKWRQAVDVPTRPMQDWNYLRASGQGVFVGASFAIANPVKDWWGEGDEKIYVDGETFPSTFGTGTEDYFGYAWCSPEPFAHAYHGQPRCDGPGNYGHTSLYRWHVLDRIPFARDFRFDMELWHWNAAAKVTMSVVAYWYARPGATDGFPPIVAADLALPVLPPYEAPRVKGAIEGEDMRVIESAGTPEPQDIGGLSGERHLWWHGGVKPGDRLLLGFPVAEAGRYRVFGRFLRAADYGIARLSVNGAPAGDPIDFYNDGVVPTPEIDLGVHALPAGENRFAVEITGANEKAVKEHMFGLDYLRLARVQ